MALETSPHKVCLSYQILRLLKIANWVFFVRSAESACCPLCEYPLKVIGSRERIGRSKDGETIRYIIRRLRCTNCHKIHHELPDILVPHKHYDAESIESAVSPASVQDVPADNATLYRWRSWVRQSTSYWQNAMRAIMVKRNRPVKGMSDPSPAALPLTGHALLQTRGWLPHLVRNLVNSCLWVHTRFAFLSVNG